ncbi:sugar phosphate nucleotidyltransferase [Thermodesulfobacteriota bacterium]
MNRDEIKGVILAAGKGTRMLPFSEKYPKPILPICNKPILQYQIEHLKEVGITDIIIVIGHLGYEIARYFGDGSQFGVSIRYIEQSETLGIAHALGKLEPHISSPFLLFLGDIFFVTKNFPTIMDIFHERDVSGVLAIKRELDPEAIKRNFAVVMDDDGRVHRVIEKPRYVTNEIKGCGLYLFDRHIFDAIRRTPRTAMRDEYEITDSIQILVEDGFQVKVAEVIEEDINVSYPQDLLVCSRKQFSHLKTDTVIGEGCRIHPEAEIRNACIGNGAQILNPIRITDSMVFPETVVSSKTDLDGIIVTPDNIIDCRILE